MSWNEEANIRCLLKFACPQIWTRLPDTGSDDRRHCDECNRDVYLVRDEEEFFRYAQEGHCVAVPIRPNVGDEGSEDYVTGSPVEPGEWHLI